MGSLLWMILSIQPLHDIEVGWPVQLDWVAVKEIWHHDKVAVFVKSSLNSSSGRSPFEELTCSKLVGNELSIRKFVTLKVLAKLTRARTTMCCG